MAKVQTEHASYAAAKARWQRCRDCYDGGDAVKARGEAYLPRLDAQTPAEYEAYKLRADFYGATQRTIDGLAGSVLRKAPTVQAPENVLPHLKDVTSQGVPLEGFAKAQIEQVLGVGRAGILVDLPAPPQVEARPYWVAYRAEQIINWRTAIRAGRRVLTLVVLREDVAAVDATDPFVEKTVVQYRVLELLAGATPGAAEVYQVTVYKARDAASTDGAPRAEFVADAPVIPTRRGAPLPFIPFVFVGPADTTPDVAKPPMLDLVDMNLSHYRSSADLERARFFTSSPTPYICGFNGQGTTPASAGNPEGTPIATPVYRIGSSVAWTFQDPNTKVDMLEYTGQGLGALRDALQDKQDLMAVLGARLLEAQKVDAEAAATVRMRHAGDESVLKKLTLAVDQALSQALRWHVWWTGQEVAEEQVGVTLAADFTQVVISPELVGKLLLSLQAGEISSETFYWNLTRAELTRPGVTFEEEHQTIDAAVREATPPALRAGSGQDDEEDDGDDEGTTDGERPPGAPVDEDEDDAA